MLTAWFLQRFEEVKVEQIIIEENGSGTEDVGTVDTVTQQYLITDSTGNQETVDQTTLDEYALEEIEGKEGYYFAAAIDQTPVLAVKMAHEIEINSPDGPKSGKQDDWLILRSETDQYIVDSQVFARTYELFSFVPDA